ncbi:MAG: hypothetical protein QOI06_2611 [Nocardioidaceae bacterium]|jgi:hypothetical protein|nr:hypothetical protein [Nocardioidaceae bacterium]
MKVERTRWEVRVTVKVSPEELVDLLAVAEQHDLGVDPQLTSAQSSKEAAYRVTLTSTGTKTSVRKGLAALTALQAFLDKAEA